MELEHFGLFLKKRREARGLSLAELSRATKIKEALLALLEAGRIEALPAQVFVRGFVCAYAREVGADELEALRRYRAHLHAAGAAQPAPVEAEIPPHLSSHESPDPEDETAANDGAPERRRFGVVMLVLLVLVVATLTLSILLRHGRAAGPGLSLSPAAHPGPTSRLT